MHLAWVLSWTALFELLPLKREKFLGRQGRKGSRKQLSLEVRIYHTGSILYLVTVVCRLLSTDLQTTSANLLMTPCERNSTQSNMAVKFVKMGGQASKCGTSWKSLTRSRIACVVLATRKTEVEEQCLTKHSIFRRQTRFSFWCYC